jgi:hypothetical protein
MKPRRLSKKEFVETYVPNSSLFFGEKPTEEDINSSWQFVKNMGKRRRAKRKHEPEMSKEEFVETLSRNSSLLGMTTNEDEINRWWDLTKLERQYKSKRTKAEKAAFLKYMQQEMMRRYPPENN